MKKSLLIIFSLMILSGMLLSSCMGLDIFNRKIDTENMTEDNSIGDSVTETNKDTDNDPEDATESDVQSEPESSSESESNSESESSSESEGETESERETETECETDSESESELQSESESNTSLEDESESESEYESESNSVADNKYTVTESYMPKNVSESLKTMFESKTAEFITYSYGSCPYVIRDVYTISDCRLLSISIPVSKTGAVDSDGNFIFTITVGNNSWSKMKNTVARVISVKVNASEYGLSANATNINKWIKVDLRDYDIVLSETQTIGFGKGSDTIIPAYLGEYVDNSNPAIALIKKDFGQMIGFFSKMGKGVDIGTSKGTLVYDFEFERVYENKAEYDAEVEAEAEYQRILAAVKEAYKYKKLSILGDSISTYAGVSNNKSYNSTIGGNAIYYPDESKALYDHTYTYWGRLLSDLEMTLCVNNSWSGSRVYDTSRMPARAGELDNNSNEVPDVIIFYMGINDLHNGSPYGDLYLKLMDSSDTRSNEEKIVSWLDTFSASSFSTFDQAYALALKTMTEKYPDAEVWCVTLNYNNDKNRFNVDKMKQYNYVICALAEYFGANIVNQQNGYITGDNCHAYTNDGNCLHPNTAGHAIMEKHIVETFYNNLNK